MQARPPLKQITVDGFAAVFFLTPSVFAVTVAFVLGVVRPGLLPSILWCAGAAVLGIGIPMGLLLLIHTGRVTAISNPRISADQFLRETWTMAILATAMSVNLFAGAFLYNYRSWNAPLTAALFMAVAATVFGFVIHRLSVIWFRFYFPRRQRQFQEREAQSDDQR
jgi:hypothetical protein